MVRFTKRQRDIPHVILVLLPSGFQLHLYEVSVSSRITGSTPDFSTVSMPRRVLGRLGCDLDF